MNRDQLLAEAKRRYPSRTRYLIAHGEALGAKDKDGNIPTCIISDPSNFRWYDNGIIESTGDSKKNGHSWNECIYYNGKWADIISIPEVNNSYIQF